MGDAAVTRYMSLTVCLGCCDMVVMVSPGLEKDVRVPKMEDVYGL